MSLVPVKIIMDQYSKIEVINNLLFIGVSYGLYQIKMFVITGKIKYGQRKRYRISV